MQPPPVNPSSTPAQLPSAWRVVALYALFSGLWIALSDEVFSDLFSDVQTLALASTLKGWFFVAVTSAVLYLLLSHLLGRYRQAYDDLRSVQQHLSHTRDRLQALLDALPDLLFEVDRKGFIHQYHSHRADLLAAAPEVFLRRRFDDVLPPDAARACHAAIEEAHAQGHSVGQRYTLDLPQGTRWFELSVAPLAQPVGSLEPHFILIARDVTQRAEAEKALELAGQVFHHAREGIMVTDADGLLIDVNTAFTRITGYSREEALGRNPRFLSSGRQSHAFYGALWDALRDSGFWSGEVWNRRKDGELYVELLTISVIRGPDARSNKYVGLFSDITALKNHQNELERAAHFDGLTGLPNRLLLTDRLQQAMAQAQRRGQRVLVVYLDLDDFKQLNTEMGHDLGDEVLVVLGQRLKAQLREGDTLARIGGDEFVAILCDVDDDQGMATLVHRLAQAVALPLTVGAHQVQTTASLGLALFPSDTALEPALDAEQLLRQADQAMYQAKLAGKNRHHLFDTRQDHAVRRHFDGIERLRRALLDGEFRLHYQPQADLHTGRICGAEALLRWQHPQRGLLSPGEFLSALQSDALAIAVGEWVLQEALEQQQHWSAQGVRIAVSVNVGAVQLQQAEFLARLDDIMKRFPDLRPGDLHLEILETSALQDLQQTTALIQACHARGVPFALDDFGTGYSTLAYLRRLPLAALKIDQSFVREAMHSAQDLAILRSVAGLARAFGLQVVAEGVQSLAHGADLLQLGCDVAQGYGVARPMPGDALVDWVQHWQAPAEWSSSLGAVQAPVPASSPRPPLVAS